MVKKKKGRIEVSVEKVREYLKQFGKENDIKEMSESTATVPLAAAALGVIEARIAKSLSLKQGEEAVVIVVAGDGKIDNRKYKDKFGVKAKMLKFEEALEYTGHAVGGVCPFALPENVKVYLDDSMKRFETVFPACGSANSAIEMTMEELEKCASNFSDWVDICKLPQE